jgi:hypothetical protein
MLLRRYRWLRCVAISAMLMAMAAFVQQSALILVSQGSASIGLMPQPAVVLAGQLHFHDHLAGNIHVHADSPAGHVHDGADTDEAVHALLCCLACTSVLVPLPGSCPIPVQQTKAVELPPTDRLIGVEPDGLNRPPSTPSIA